MIWVKVPDTANAFVIFETLNDRGLVLAISDLLKNFLFLTAENRISEVQHLWVSMLATLEPIDGERVVVDFVRHLWSSKHGSTREHKLYGEIKSAITNKRGAVDFAKELMDGASMYAAMLNTDHELWKDYGSTARGYMGTINLLQMVQVRPLLLAVLSTFTVREVRKTLKLMVSWGTRFLITGGLGGGTLEKHYANRAMEVRSGKIKTAKELAKSMESVTPTDTAFEAAFTTAIVSKSFLSRYYLRALEIQNSNATNPEHVPNPNQEEINLEHVLPQSSLQNWPHITKEVARAFYNRLGNHALLQSNVNKVAGNQSFKDKKPVYAKSEFQLTAEIAQEVDWNVAQIEKRQARLAKLAVLTWPITVR